MDFKTIDLGLIEYKTAWDLQKEVLIAVKAGKSVSTLMLCRHYPVITLGRLGRKENILVDTDIPVIQVERGGDVTYHGPGQLTVYPIFNLEHFKKDIHWFLRSLEEVVIDLLADFGIFTGRKPGATGVWIGNGKICSIGIAIRNWVTFHGLTINIKEDDLVNFGLIRPCGMDIKMVSLEGLLGRPVEIDAIKEKMISKFEAVFSQEAACLK